jgi:hypothetical protein
MREIGRRLYVVRMGFLWFAFLDSWDTRKDGFRMVSARAGSLKDV